MIRRRLILKVVCALVFGVYCTVTYLKRSPRFIGIIHHQLEQVFKKQLQCYFTGTIKAIDFFPVALHLKNTEFKPTSSHDGWSWKAEELTITLSLLPYLFTKKIGLDVLFQNFSAFSLLKKGKLGIIQYVQTITGGFKAELPFKLQNILFKKADFSVQEKDLDLIATIAWNGQIGNAGKFLKSRLYVTDGSIKCGSIPVCSNFSGISSATVEVDTSFVHYRIDNDLRVTLPQLAKGKQECLLEGTISNGKSAYVMYNSDYSFHVDSLRTYSKDPYFLCQGAIKVPLDYLCRIFGHDEIAKRMQGTCDVLFVGQPFKALSGTVLFKDTYYKGHGLEKIALSFLTDQQKVRGIVSLGKEQGLAIGLWEGDISSKYLSAKLANVTAWPLNKSSSWNIRPYKGKVSFVVTKDLIIECNYQIATEHSKTESRSYSHGEVKASSSGDLHANGEIDNNKYAINLQLFPHFKPLSIIYKDQNKKNLLQCILQGPQQKKLKAMLSYDFIHSLIYNYLDYELPGQGTLHLEGTVEDDGIKAHMYTQDTTIQLPETYNFLSNFTADFIASYATRKLTIKNISAQLHKGSVTCKKAIIYFTPDLSNIVFMHIPVYASKCFLNWRDDFFTVASSFLTFQKRKNEPYNIDGFVIVEKGQLKENPLSREGQKELTQFMIPSSLFEGQPLTMNIGIMTKEPLYIKTPLLKSRAVVDVVLSHTLRSPELVGQLRLLGGSLHFSKNPLHINRSELRFISQQPYDPLINFVAQGSIKKYLITLSVGGSLQEPHIVLDSTPSLQDEQILALLFTGSAQESLNVMVPTLVMRNVENILFGATGSSETNSIFDSLRRIKLVPSFADQTGRGGFRGAVEIDVSDHLHASIQKNFSQSEDTRIEVEYLVSDDVSLKAIKDERSDIGGEIEMRFKF